MIGHKQIVEARVNGFNPKHVWIHLLNHEPTEFDKRDAEDALLNGFRAQILIAPSENIRTLQLVGVRGLIVHIIAEDDDRAIRMCNHLHRFQPSAVLLCVGGELVQELAA